LQALPPPEYRKPRPATDTGVAAGTESHG